ncbi:DNA repair protein RecO [Sneathiella sp.]|uniref:DNA repair protein RecO n=1 Tax=Sneathiella sp. TaxID=1964365 RepID=UPI002FE35250
MQWIDSGILVSLRKHGENSVIIHAFTRDHGRAAGLVRGGVGRRLRGILQPGNELRLSWRGRLAEHLGSFTVEAEKTRAGLLFEAGDALIAASTALSLLDIVLPEGEAHPALFEATGLLLDALGDAPEHWPLLLARWELGLLHEIGYGLDLSHCVVTGATADLVYVSPKSGRAVSREAGRPYHDRLLPLPAFLRRAALGPEAAEALPPDEISEADFLSALRLTGYFLEKFMAGHHPKAQLAARGRMMAALARKYGENAP